MYIRHDKDCKPAAVQPKSELKQDVYGNSYRNWCVDYRGYKISRAVVKSGCAGEESLTYVPHDTNNNSYVKDKFVPRDWFNNIRQLDDFDDSPVYPIDDYTDLDLVLGLERDVDLVIAVESYLSTIKLEPSTIVVK